MNEGYGRMRVSDAERDEVAGQLREHHVLGRLDVSELDERLAATFAAKIRDDLAVVTHDLPSPDPWRPVAQTSTRTPQAQASQRTPATRAGSAPTRFTGRGLMLLVLLSWFVLGGIGNAIAVAAHWHGPGPFPLLIMLALAFIVLRRRRARHRPADPAAAATGGVTGSAAADSARTR